ncbi:MAG: hypothetical protein FWE34_05610 [Defluviitaleaceae bacterium]|nr:hypothetical protein [Defluviitaleaceae bacterium]
MSRLYVELNDFFPSILRLIIQGEYVYIPKFPDNYDKWGESTGAKP